MREDSLIIHKCNHRALHRNNPQGLSSSCPSLCRLTLPDGTVRYGEANNSDPELMMVSVVNGCSSNISSPMHMHHHHQQQQVNALLFDFDRRRSLTDLEGSKSGGKFSAGSSNQLLTQSMVRCLLKTRKVSLPFCFVYYFAIFL